MATKTRRWVVLALLALFVLTSAMYCGWENVGIDGCRSIPELENVKVYVTISPVKEVYEVGDTITCALRAEKKDWNNWERFDRIEFSKFSLSFFDGETGTTTWSDNLLPKKSMVPTRATVLPNDESYIEQVTYYKLAGAGVYLLGSSYPYPREDLKTFSAWPVTYEDTDGSYCHYVPVHFNHTGKREMLIRVVE